MVPTNYQPTTHLGHLRVCAVCASMRPHRRPRPGRPILRVRRRQAAGRCCWLLDRRAPRPPTHLPSVSPAHRHRLRCAPSAAPYARCPRRAALASSPGGASGRIGRTRRERALRAAWPRARAAGGARTSSTRPRSCALPCRACRVRGTKRDRAEPAARTHTLEGVEDAAGAEVAKLLEDSVAHSGVQGRPAERRERRALRPHLDQQQPLRGEGRHRAFSSTWLVGSFPN